MAEKFETEQRNNAAERQTLSVKVPYPEYTHVGYVNIRGASLNYVIGKVHNKESAHCSARAD